MRFHGTIRRLHRAIAICAALSVTACAQVNYLRDAQETFSNTAAIENALQFGLVQPDEESSASLSLQSRHASIVAGYASVIHSLDSLDEQQIGKLKGDGLYAPVLALKAMSYWRLREYDKALAAAQEASNLGADVLGPRDRALMAALPGLVRNDQAAQKLGALREGARPADEAQREEAFRSILGLLNSAEKDLMAARAKAPAGHDVQLYLVQAQLAADKNVNDACTAYATSAEGRFDIGKDAGCKGQGAIAWGSSPSYDCRAFAHVESLKALVKGMEAGGRTVAAWRKVTNPPDSRPAGCS